MSKEQGIIPTIRFGHMAAPGLLHSLEIASQKGNPYPFHFKKTKNERALLPDLKRDWKKAHGERWARKKYIIHEILTF